MLTRRDIDYKVVPKIFYGDPEQLFAALENQGCDFLSDVFNFSYEEDLFYPDDFSLSPDSDGDDKKLFYAGLTDKLAEDENYCSAYIFTLDRNKTPAGAAMFTVEENTEEGAMLYRVNKDGLRLSCGKAGDLQDNLERVKKMAFSDKVEHADNSKLSDEELIAQINFELEKMKKAEEAEKNKSQADAGESKAGSDTSLEQQLQQELMLRKDNAGEKNAESANEDKAADSGAESTWDTPGLTDIETTNGGSSDVSTADSGNTGESAENSGNSGAVTLDLDKAAKEAEAAGGRRIRYNIDFQLVPKMIRNPATADTFIKALLATNAGTLADLFNTAYGSRDFYRGDFSLGVHDIGKNKKVLYVNLPEKNIDCVVYCAAYCIVVDFIGDSVKNAWYFSVEKSRMGTGCFGTMANNGNHMNYGNAGTELENVRKAANMVFGIDYKGGAKKKGLFDKLLGK